MSAVRDTIAPRRGDPNRSERVRKRLMALAQLNACSPEEKEVLADLARLCEWTEPNEEAGPEWSDASAAWGRTFPEPFFNLVQYHATVWSWYHAAQGGHPPSDTAWLRMARCLNVRLLCLFLVADGLDCPGGWRGSPLRVWFLDEVRRRNLTDTELVLDDAPPVGTAGFGRSHPTAPPHK